MLAGVMWPHVTQGMPRRKQGDAPILTAMQHSAIFPSVARQTRLSIMAPKRKSAAGASSSAAPAAKKPAAAVKKAKAAPAPEASAASDGKKLSLVIEACKS